MDGKENSTAGELTFINDEVLKLPSNHTCLNDGDNKKEMLFNFMDTMQPHTYTNIAFFYRAVENVSNEFTKNLKVSLQKVIEEKFPEMTGSINYTGDYLTLKYSNVGYRFIEAKSSSEDVDFENLPYHFFPSSQISNLPILECDPVFLCQVTYVPGGVVLAVSIYHAICDVHSFVDFIKDWMKYSNCESPLENLTGKSSGRRDLLPMCKKGYIRPLQIQEGWQQRRFHVNKKSLDLFKQDFLEHANTSVSFLSNNDIMVSVFWRAVMNAKEIQKSSCEMVVECRERLKLPENFFSNCVYLLEFSQDLDVVSSAQLSAIIRKSVINLSKETIMAFIEKSKQVENVDGLKRPLNLVHDGIVASSWAKFPFYEIDFGLGQPADVTTFIYGSYNLLFILPDHPGAESFSVIIVLKEDELESLVANPEIQRLVS